MLNNTQRAAEDAACLLSPQTRNHHRARDFDLQTTRFARSGGTGLSPKQKVVPEKVLQAFNTWSFKREQPSDAELLRQTIASAIAAEAPVPFVLYWGKGPRSTVDEPEAQCLDYLAAMAARIRAVYAPGAAIRLICTDTHATLNGHKPEKIQEYFNGVEVAAAMRGFDGCRLSDLVRAAEAVPSIGVEDETLADDMLLSLAECAKKWFRGEGTAEQGAMQYYQMNMVERRAVELAFPDAVFVTFNGSEYRSLFPKNMPIFYMYSLKRGFGVKPWFLPADGKPSFAAAAPSIAP